MGLYLGVLLCVCNWAWAFQDERTGSFHSLENLSRSEWCDDTTRAISSKLSIQIDKFRSALPTHQTRVFIRAVDVQVLAIITDSETYELVAYKNAYASKRMLELIERLVGMESCPPADAEIVERSRGQYERLEAEFCQYLAERSDQ